MDKENVAHLHISILLSGKNRRMDKENVAHLHISVLLSGKNQGHLEFSMQMDGIRNTVLSEVTLTQKDEYGMYSLISGY